MARRIRKPHHHSDGGVHDGPGGMGPCRPMHGLGGRPADRELARLGLCLRAVLLLLFFPEKDDVFDLCSALGFFKGKEICLERS